MADVYATIGQQPRDVVETIAAALEVRAASPQQRAMVESYLSRIALPPGARILDVGCGTGAVTEILAGWPGVGEVIGIDASPVLVEQARARRGAIDNVSFQIGDGRSLGLPDAAFDAVTLHTVLCHVPEPERVLAEAFRVLRADGWLAVFDGDYETITTAIAPHDPLASCIESFKEAFVNDIWLMRKLPAMVAHAGLRTVRFDSHGYIESAEPTYLLTVVDRGVDSLMKADVVGRSLADALKGEARRRVEKGQFFGHIGYASLLAQKPRRALHAN